MANFKKSDLKLTYSWTAAAETDNASIIGFPDNKMLDRHEGYEVLPFLNRYMTDKSWTTITILHKLEDALRDRLPGSLRSHANIKNWLNEHFIA